jgi:hypothetical protein
MTQRDLSFAIALAPDWQQIDLLAPEADRLIDASLAAALARGARGGPHARLLMTRSLYAVTPAGEPLAAGLTVALADREAPVSSAPLEADDFDGAEVARSPCRSAAACASATSPPTRRWTESRSRCSGSST